MGVLVLISYAIPILDRMRDRVGILALLAMLTIGMLSGVCFVCAMVLTGPVFKNQINTTTNDPETWGGADRFAATLLSGLVITGVVGTACHFLKGILR